MTDVEDSDRSDAEGSPCLEKSGAQKGRKITNQEVFDCYSYDEILKEYKCIVAPTKCSFKTKNRHSGNMFKHLSSMHKDRAENISKNKKNTVKTPIRKAKHIVLNGVKMSGKALQLYCLLLVAEQGASFKLLDSPAFQSIVRPYLDALPASEKVTINRRNIPGLIPEYANKVREIIADEVKGKLISLKLDGCTRKHRHFLGITAQFVDAGKLTVRTLAVEELFIKNSAPLIKTEVTRALDRFSIMVQNLFSITCDNAANYLLMARLFDKAAKELYAKLESLQYDEEDEDLRQWAEEDDDEDWPSIELIAEDSTSIQSSRCGAHTLQLAVDDAIKETPEVKALLTKVRDLAKFLRTPTMVRELKKQDLTLPKLDVVTRWGSSFDMCESVLGLKEFSQKSFSKADQQQYGLSANDWSKVEELIKCLRPARKASIKLQGKSILLGDFFRIWSTCYDKLTKLKHPLAEALCCAMEKRKQSEMYKNHAQGEKLSSLFGYPGFKAALLMDPRYFTLLDPSDVQEAKTHLVQVWRRLCHLRGETERETDEDGSEESSSTVVSQEVSTEDDSDEESTFAKDLKRRNKEKVKNMDPKRSNQPALKILQLLDTYLVETPPLAEKEDVLMYWHNKRVHHPILSELAFIVLAQPATQVAVERIFSTLKFILNPLRFRLSSQHVDDMMILHCNADLLHKIAESELVKQILGEAT